MLKTVYPAKTPFCGGRGGGIMKAQIGVDFPKQKQCTINYNLLGAVVGNG